jgi:hypothetical protein
MPFMSAVCAVCEASVDPEADHCATCGFPADLASEAARLIEAYPEPAEPLGVSPGADDSSGRVTGRERHPTPAARDPQAEVINRIARDVSLALVLLQSLGGEGTEISTELAQAALTQADGRVGEVLVLLRDAQARVSARLLEQFERRMKQLEQRQANLVTSGVAVNLGPELDRVRSELRSGRREEALRRIEVIDRLLVRMESDWRGLQGLLRQIENLREASQLLELDVSEIDDCVRQVQVILARPSLDVSALDQAAELAAEALMRLHDSVPMVLEETLGRLREEVADWPPTMGGKSSALALQADALRHLKANRLYEATLRTQELKRLVADSVRRAAPSLPEAEPLEPAPSPPSPGPVASPVPLPGRIAPTVVDRVTRPAPILPRSAPASPSTPRPVPAPPPPAPSRAPPMAPSDTPAPELMHSLVASARELAARIRLLPADSELARTAAVEIRSATELLRERRTRDAERTLAELKARLDRAGLGGV